MGNPLIGQILGSVLGRSMSGGAAANELGNDSMGGNGGGAMPGGLGGILGGVLGGGLPGGLRTGGAAGAGGRNAMLAMMLPLVLGWVQRNGGIGNVLERLRQQGQGGHVDSWVGTAGNQPMAPGAARQLLGPQELSNLSGQLGVGEDEVAHGVSEILPELVDQLSPQGAIHPDADRQLEAGQSALDRLLGQVH
jgi:uncharacterized protein YidB (DUF937 family)